MSKFHVLQYKHRRLFDTIQDVKTKRTTSFPREIKLPQRSTARSAGYDFYLTEDVKLLPHQTTLVITDICFECADDENLDLVIRSSLAINNSLQIINSPGIIDADYYNNEKNGGNNIVAIHNFSGTTYIAKAGEKFCQGIIRNYKTTEDDEPVNEKRTGGIGSTGK